MQESPKRRRALKQRHAAIAGAAARGRRQGIRLSPLDALKQRQFVRQNESSWQKTEVESFRETVQAERDAVAERAAAMSVLAGRGRSRRKVAVEPEPEPEYKVTGILAALQAKKSSEDSLLLGAKRWCKKCLVAFEGEACPRSCSRFLYVDAIPKEAQAGILKEFHLKQRAEAKERSRLQALAATLRPKSPPKSQPEPESEPEPEPEPELPTEDPNEISAMVRSAITLYAEDDSPIVVPAGWRVVVTDASTANWWVGHPAGDPDSEGRFFPDMVALEFSPLMSLMAEEVREQLPCGTGSRCDRWSSHGWHGVCAAQALSKVDMMAHVLGAGRRAKVHRHLARGNRDRLEAYETAVEAEQEQEQEDEIAKATHERVQQRVKERLDAAMLERTSSHAETSVRHAEIEAEMGGNRPFSPTLARLAEMCHLTGYPAHSVARAAGHHGQDHLHRRRRQACRTAR